jgi:hypothetical protein
MNENEATNATNTAHERRGEPASGVADSRDGLIDRPPARETLRATALGLTKSSHR